MTNNQIKIDLVFQANTQAATNNIQQLNNLLQQLSTKTTIGINNGSIDKAVMSVQQLQTALGQAVNVDTGKINLNKLNMSLKQSGLNLSQLSKNLQNLGPSGEQAFIKLANAMSSAETPMVQLNSKLKDFGVSLLNTVKWQLASNMIHGIQSALTGAINYAKDLNGALNDIRIVTGKSASEMAKFANIASKTAKELNSTVTEYSKAALIFYQQGLDGAAVEERTNTVIKLAQVTGESAEKISDQMTAIWNNFDDGSKSLEYYADVITKLGAETAASSDEIVQGLEKFAATAQTIGLSYEYASASLATVVAETRQAPEVVGTAFKTLFARLQGLSLGETLEDGTNLNKYSEALSKVGVQIKDQYGELKNADTILKETAMRWEQLGQDQKVALAQTVGGMRQYNQFMSLMENWDKIELNVELAELSEGTLSQQQKTWSESWEAASKRVEQSTNELYDSILNDELFIGLSDLWSSLIDGVTNFINSVGGIVPIVGVLVALFSKQLFPIIQNGFTRLKNNISVLTGSATKQVIDRQNEMREELQNKISTTDSEALKQQYILSDKLIESRQELARTSKNMSIADREAAERRMALIEQTANEIQSSLELQKNLENEIKLKEKLAVDKGIRKQAAENILDNEYQQNKNDYKNEDDYFQEKYGMSKKELAHNATTKKTYLTKKDLSKMNTETWEGSKEQIEIDEEIQKTEEKYGLTDASNKKKKKNKELNKLYNTRREKEKTYEQRKRAAQTTLEVQENLEQVSENQVSVGVAEGFTNFEDSNKHFSKFKRRAASVFNKQQSDTDSTENNTLSTGSSEQTTPPTGSMEVDASLENLKKAHKLRAEFNMANKKATSIQKDLNVAVKNEADIRGKMQKLSKTSKDYRQLEKELQKNNKVLQNGKNKMIDLAKAMGMTEEEAKDLVEQLINIDENSNTKINNKGFEDLKQGFTDAEQGAEELADNIQESLTNTDNADEIQKISDDYKTLADEEVKTAEATKNLTDEMNNSNGQEGYGKKISNISTSVMSIAGAASAAVGGVMALGEAFNSENSPMENFISYAMSIISLLPVMGNLFEWLAKKRKKASAETIKDNNKERTSTFATAAAKVFEKAIDAFGIWGVIIGGALAAAIIGGAIYALSVSDPGPSEDEQKEESLSNSVASLTEEYGKAKEAADNFKSSVSDYSDGIKSLSELEEGTAEYRKTLEDTNNKAKELIETYGLLSSDYNLDANGVITFNTGVLESKQEELDAAANDVRIRLLNAEMALKTVQTKNKINNDETDFKDINGNDVDFDEDEREEIAEFMQKYGRDSRTGTILAEEDLKKAIDNGSLSEELKEKLESQTDVTLEAMVSWGDSLTEASNANKDYAKEIMKLVSDEVHADFLDQISKDKDGEIDIGKRELHSRLLAQLDESLTGDYVEMIQTSFKDFEDAVDDDDYGDNLFEDDELTKLKNAFEEIYGKNVDYNAKLNEIFKTSVDFEADADEIDELYELMLEAQGYKNVIVNDDSGEITVSYSDDPNGDGPDSSTIKNEDAFFALFNYIQSAIEKDIGTQKAEENQELTESMAKNIYNAGVSNSLGIDFSGVVESAIVNDKKQSFDFSTLLSELSMTDLEKFQNMTEDEFSKITGVTKDILADSVYEDQLSVFKKDFIKQLESDLNNTEKIDSAFLGRVKSLELDEKVYSQYRDSLAKTNKTLKENSTLLNEVAISNMRLDRGVKDLVDDWEDLSKSMSSGDLATQAEAITKMEEPLKDILNLTDNDFSLLPPNFAQSHFKEIEDVVNGVPGAIQKLRKIANAEKILFNIGIELDADNTLPDKIEELNEQIINYDLSDVEAGAKIDDQEFIAACLNLINVSKGTKEDIEQLFKGWGLKIAVEGETGAFTIKSITKDESYLDYYTNKVASKSALKEQESSDPAENVKLEDIVQRYKEINDQLEDISRNLDKINDKMDNAYGQARLDAMDEYIANLEKENKALVKKGKEIKSNISKDQQTVADAAAGVGMSVKFDKNGNIANATQIEKAWYKRLSSVTTKDAQDEIQRQIDIWEDAQGDYEDSLNEFWNNEEAKRENRREQQQQQYDKWSYKIELDVELDEGELALIDYYQEKLSDNIYGMAESAALTGEEINITLGNLADREKQYAELTNLYESGKISQAQYAEGLKELQEAELEDLNTLRERKKELEEYYRNTLSMASEEIDKYTARLERSTSVLEHYQTMLELTGQEQNYEAIGKILEGQQKTIENQYAASKKEYEMYKKQADEKYAAMQAARGTDNYENLKEDWEAAVELANNAQDRMNENAQKKAEIAVSIFENSLNQMYQRMESILTNSRSFDEINTKMEHQQSLQEEYLTTTNKIYETTKMMRNLQNEIDKTTNRVAKQKLKAFQQETKQLQEQSKLSQFELDIQQAKYDLLLAEIALQEAQNAKSTVRLQRDSEGNFGYVYTANQEQVSGAQQAVDDAENALYNIQLEGANNYAQQSFQLQQEGLDALRELNEMYRAGDIQSEEEYQRRREEIINYYTQRLTDISNLYGIAVADDSEVAADAWSTNITDLVADAETWKSETTKYTSEVDQAFGTLNTELEKIAKEMGVNLDDIEDNINDVTKESDKWSKELQDDVIPDLEDTIDEVDDLANELLKDLIPQIKDATKKGEGLAKEMYNVQLKLSGLAGEAESSANRAAIAAGSWREYWNAVNNTGGGGSTTILSPSAAKDLPPDDGDDPDPELTPAKGMPGHDWRFKIGDYAMLGSSNTYAYDSYRTTELFNYGNYENGLKIMGYDMVRGLYPMYKVKDTSGNVAWVDESKLIKPWKTITKFDTGGYTGEWGNEGKLAALHEKELVLNKEDTANFLASLELLHNIIKMIDINASNSLISRLDSANLKTNKSNDVLEQHVTIEAHFPAAKERNEIEEALMNLTNEASQYINRKNN